MSVSIWQDRSSQARHAIDFLVVGAGISGASAAYWLASRGERVAVVDARDVASGASGKSAGMLLLGTADPYSRFVDLYGRDRAREIWAFTRESRALLTEHVLDRSDAGLLRLLRTGTVSAAVSEHEKSELQRSCGLLLEDGFVHELLDADTMEQAYGSRAFLSGVRDPAGMTVDPARLTEQILLLACDRGAQFFPHHELVALEDAGDGVVVRTSRASFDAQIVLLCANAYSPLLHPHLAGRVYPARGQMLATAPLPKRIVPWGVYADFGYEYFWQLPTLELVAGGWRQEHADAEKGYSDEITGPIQDGIESFISRVLPAAAGAKITHRWSGVMGFSGDGLPFAGDLPARPRIKFLAGHTGHGLGFGFLAARKLVELALDGASPGWLSANRPTLRGG
ncbi:MAG: FAD-binding oxidoreductase [Sandaracinaceae bacterium]|nr:FAD-binding oxidoreductase [Sandaracinaceae bacterium]